MKIDTAQEIIRPIGELTQLMKHFDEDCEIQPESAQHADPNKEAGISEMIAVIHTNIVFRLASGRAYTTFKNTMANPLHMLNIMDK